MVYFNLKNTFIQIRAIRYVKDETLAWNMNWYFPERLYIYSYININMYIHILLYIFLCVKLVL